MVSHHRTGVTYDEFEDYIQRPENVDRLLELINGEIFEKVPTEEHGIIVLRIGSALLSFNDQHLRGIVTTEARHRLPYDNENARLPDISFRSTRSPVVRQGAIPSMPDLAVEVQSPSQSDEDLAEKAAYYLANGSRMVWLVYPAKRLVAVHQREQIETFAEGDVLSGGDLLPGFTLAVSDVFRFD